MRHCRWLSYFFILSFVCLVLLVSCQSLFSTKPQIQVLEIEHQRAPLSLPLEREWRAVWIASVSNLDWPSAPNLSEQEQKKEIRAKLDLIEELNFNTVFLQVRPDGAVIYPSVHEGITPFLSTKKLHYDPLEFWINEAHTRGLRLHAWINPYRVIRKGTVPEEDWVKKMDIENLYWHDPSYEESRQRVYALIEEIIENYDIDGISFDDYFYPYASYHQKQGDFPDEEEYLQYLAENDQDPFANEAISKADWRRNNINLLIEGVHQLITENKPSLLFGISPFGILYAIPQRNIQGLASYHELFIDPLAWVQKGWIDYLSPQLYWSRQRPNQDFSQLLSWWIESLPQRSALFPSLIAEPVGISPEEAPEEIHYQIQTSRTLQDIPGFIFFRSSFLFDQRYQEMLKTLLPEKSLPPLIARRQIAPPEPQIRFDKEKNELIFLNYKKEWIVLEVQEQESSRYRYTLKQQATLPFDKEGTHHYYYLSNDGTLSEGLTLRLLK